MSEMTVDMKMSAGEILNEVRRQQEEMNTIEDILLAIYDKHDVAASYTVNNFGCEISYVTYIALGVDTHKKHSSKEEAVQRLKDFLELDDILSYNKDALIQKIKQLEDEEEDVQYDLTYYKTKLKELENDCGG